MGTMETEHEDADTAVASAGQVPPARRGSRDERRESTLRALAAGQDARCAYCGEPLPPLPPRGGRPTPYCPPDPERYGNWGAKTISCAMLDEQREIWTRVYGPDQPMTHLDVHALDERLAALRCVLDPAREEVTALHEHVTRELDAALSARAAAETDRDHATEQARAAAAEREEAVAAAERAREAAEAARTEQAAAEQRADDATAERDRARTGQASAERTAEQARTDRQDALGQAAAAQQRITELQDAVATERAAHAERHDRLRGEHDQARRQLHDELTADRERRLRDQSTEHAERLAAVQTAADERIGELTARLTEATRAYADNLAPLHERIQALSDELAAQRGAATTARERLAGLHGELSEILVPDAGDAAWEHARTVLARHAEQPPQEGARGTEGAADRDTGRQALKE